MPQLGRTRTARRRALRASLVVVLVAIAMSATVGVPWAAGPLTGSVGPDRLTARAAGQAVRGAGDPDTILGGAGHDKLYGETGPDRIFGRAGQDIIEGSSGDDLMDGGED